jgi:tRNA pseudouridine55 synthase
MQTNPNDQTPSGLLLINKPEGITSFDCIRRLRRTLGMKKIGHAGTLDPAARGLMLLLVGSATKQAERFSKLDKTYVAEITLGATSTTGDREGELTKIPNSKFPIPNSKDINAVLAQFTGQITQTPSMYSAIKIGGQEAYKRARRGETVEMPSRVVTIYDIQVLSYEYPLLQIETRVSSGTYIRSLAADIGEKLGTGAYLSALQRTSVGDLLLGDAIELDAATIEDLIPVTP